MRAANHEVAGLLAHEMAQVPARRARCS